MSERVWKLARRMVAMATTNDPRIASLGSTKSLSKQIVTSLREMRRPMTIIPPMTRPEKNRRKERREMEMIAKRLSSKRSPDFEGN